VFTERYALSPYIKQIRFVFKGLITSKAVRFKPSDSFAPVYNFISKKNFHSDKHLARNGRDTRKTHVGFGLECTFFSWEKKCNGSYILLNVPDKKFHENRFSSTRFFYISKDRVCEINWYISETLLSKRTNSIKQITVPHHAFGIPDE
jgi:hypothetical protein